MLSEYAAKLAQNITTTDPIDVVLDGGLFNGSYLVGVCYFLKSRGNVARISGCSIGSLVGLLYWADTLDVLADEYDETVKQFRQTKTFYSYADRVRSLVLPDDILARVNGRLFITYYAANSHQYKKHTKRRYKTVDELRECVIRSSFLPWLSGPEALYQGQYLDGTNAYMFNKPLGSKPLRRILFVDLHSTWRKCGEVFVAKNERTNAHRILAGLVDAHSFFISGGQDTELCSYVDGWSARRRIGYFARQLVEYVMTFIAFCAPTIPIDADAILYRVVREFMHAIVDRYVV